MDPAIKYVPNIAKKLNKMNVLLYHIIKKIEGTNQISKIDPTDILFL